MILLLLNMSYDKGQILTPPPIIEWSENFMSTMISELSRISKICLWFLQVFASNQWWIIDLMSGV